MSARHFIDLTDFSGAELRGLLRVASDLKAKRERGVPPRVRPLAGKTRAMIYVKASSRRRVCPSSSPVIASR